MNNITLVTGLAGSGKTTLAQRLVDQGVVDVRVSMDQHRYVPGTWTKLCAREFFKSMDEELKKHEGKRVVVEGSCNDASDPENAREAYFEFLLEQGAEQLMVFAPKPLTGHIEDIIARSFGRLLGTMPKGAAEETPGTVSRLVVKMVQNYPANVDALERLKRFAQKHGVKASVV